MLNKIIILESVSDFIDGLSNDDAGKVTANLKSLVANRKEGLKLKTLSGKIKELIVGRYRIVFFSKGNVIYVIDAFKKQSQKIPIKIIRRAKNIYRDIVSN